MITLHISLQKPNHRDIKERLEEITIPSEIINLPENSKPFLKDGQKVYQGKNEINNFLLELEKFVDKWYECQCD
jgi:hypothetical protein